MFYTPKKTLSTTPVNILSFHPTRSELGTNWESWNGPLGVIVFFSASTLGQVLAVDDFPSSALFRNLLLTMSFEVFIFRPLLLADAP